MKSRNELFRTSKKHERRVKELQAAGEEDQKAVAREKDQNVKLQAKLKSVKRSLEETVRSGHDVLFRIHVVSEAAGIVSPFGDILTRVYACVCVCPSLALTGGGGVRV